MDYRAEHIYTEEFIRSLVENCAKETARGAFQTESREGRRVADNFRRLFPDVSDRDLGTMVVVIVQALTYLSNVNVLELSRLMESMIASYSFTAADILKSVIDLGEL